MNSVDKSRFFTSDQANVSSSICAVQDNDLRTGVKSSTKLRLLFRKPVASPLIHNFNSSVSKMQNNNGFSFPELLVAVSVLSVIIVGMVEMFVSASVLGELAGNGSLAMDSANSVLEEIRQTPYDDIVSIYGVGGSVGNTFDLTSPVGKGVITIDSSVSGLLAITIDVSYKNKYDRITGEDINLNGVLDSGEDTNGNGRLDSPLTLTTYIAQR